MKRRDGAIVALGLGLAGVLAIELLPAVAQTAPEPAVGVPVQPDAAAPADAPPLAAWADISLGRPLFAPDRRASQAGPAVREHMPRLAGTIRSGDSPLAIFEPEGNGKSLVLGRDGTVAGWTVADITDGAVTLVRAGRTDTLQLSYANRPVVARPNGPPAVVILHDKRTDPFLQP
jgi:hypothetical protein